jgi:hypothetical protein
MLPDDHPSSFYKLTGLAWGELCLVLEASDFVVKKGKNKNSYSFQSDAFNGFLQSPQLQLIDKSVSQPSILKHERHWAYLIGKTSGDTCLQFFTLQLDANVNPPPANEGNVRCIALKEFASYKAC